MGGREFLKLTSDDLKRYREEYIKLPPRRDFLKRIEDAIDHEIPFEYLVDAGVINVNILKQLDITEDDFNYIKEYMIFKGYKDALKLKWKKVTRSPKEEVKEDLSDDVADEIEIEDTLDVSEYKSKITLLEIELSKNKEMLDDISNKLNKTNRRLNKERDEKTKYKVEIEKKELLIKTLENELKKVEYEYKETEEEINKLRRELEDIYVESSKKDLIIEGLQGDIQSKEEKNREILDDIKELRENLFRLNLDLKNKDSIIDEIKKSNSDLTVKVNELQGVVKDRELDIKDLNKTINELQEVIKNKDLKEEDLKNEIKELQTNIKTKEGNIKELNKTVENLQENIKNQEIKEEDLKNKIKELNKTIGELQEHVNLNVDKDLLAADLNNKIEKKKEETQIFINKLKDELEELRQELDRVKKENKARIEKITIENKNKIDDLVNAKNTEIERVIKEKNLEIEKVINEKNQEIKELQKKTRVFRGNGKLVSLFGRYSYFIEENISMDDVEFIFEGMDADLFILTTDISESSVRRFKDNYKDLKDKNLLKVMFMWDKNDPFTPKSVVGTDLDLVIENKVDMYKNSWVEKDNLWIKEITEMIKSRLV